MLGSIVEKVSGKKYLDFLKEKIFAPLDMNETGYADYDADVPFLSKGYLQGMAPDNKKYNYSMLLSIGAMYSTLADMKKWICCSANMFGTQGTTPLGWASGVRFNQDAYWHSGITNSYCCFCF